MALRLAKSSAPVAKPAARAVRVVRPSVAMRTMPVRSLRARARPFPPAIRPATHGARGILRPARPRVASAEAERVCARERSERGRRGGARESSRLPPPFSLPAPPAPPPARALSARRSGRDGRRYPHACHCRPPRPQRRGHRARARVALPLLFFVVAPSLSPLSHPFRDHRPRPPHTPLPPQDKSAVETAVKIAEDACKDGKAGECAAAWDNVRVAPPLRAGFSPPGPAATRLPRR